MATNKIEELNAEYIAFKNSLDSVKKEIKAINDKVEALITQKYILQGELGQARQNKDSRLVKKKEMEIAKLDGEIAEERGKAETKEGELKLFQRNIDERVHQISQNPGMRSVLHAEMQKAEQKRIKQLEDKRKDNEEDITQIRNEYNNVNKVKNIVNDNGKLKSALEKMLRINKTIEMLKKKKPSDPTINTLQSQLDADKSAFLTELTNKKVRGVTQSDIDLIISKGVVNVEKGYDAKGNKVETLKADVGKTFSGIKEDYNNKFNKAKKQKSELKDEIDTANRMMSYGKNTKKPKWFQFIKKFKNWKQKRQQKAMPVLTYNDSNAENDYINSLKVDVVKEAAKSYTQDINDRVISDKEYEAYLNGDRDL